MNLIVHDSSVFIRYRDGQPGLPAIWCVHGFGASGATYLEAFDAPELEPYALFVPDFPGFGESPERTAPQGIAEAAALLVELVTTHSATDAVVLLAHSAGGLIAMRAVEALPQVKGVLSVEGNLTEADTFISGKAAAADDIDTWRSAMIEELREQGDEATRRYCCDLARAAPATLRGWAVETVRETGVTLAGERFGALSIPKLYAYGRKSIPQTTLELLIRHGVPRVEFADSGHCPMVDEPARFYAEVARFVAGATG